MGRSIWTPLPHVRSYLHRLFKEKRAKRGLEHMQRTLGHTGVSVPEITKAEGPEKPTSVTGCIVVVHPMPKISFFGPLPR